MSIKDFQTHTRGESVEDVFEWIASMKARGLAPGTIRCWFDAARSCYETRALLGEIPENPFRLAGRFVSFSNEQVRPTQLIPFALIPAIVTAPPRRTWEGRRDRAMLAILFGCGLRRSELVALNIGDVQNTPDGIIFLRLRSTKGRESADQPVPQFAWEHLSEYIAHCSRYSPQRDFPLFPTWEQGEQRMSASTLARRFKAYCAEVGIDAAPHAARATAASYLKYLGYHDEDVAFFLRHKTSQMVRIYDKRVRGLSNNIGRLVDYRDREK